MAQDQRGFCVNADDVLRWVAIKNVRINQKILESSFDKVDLAHYMGQLRALEELRLEILKQTNPHNREDIKKGLEREQLERDEQKFLTVANLAKKYSGAFRASSIRWLIFNEEHNGFSRCIKRVGKKLLIDVAEFEQYIASNPGRWKVK